MAPGKLLLQKKPFTKEGQLEGVSILTSLLSKEKGRTLESTEKYKCMAFPSRNKLSGSK